MRFAIAALCLSAAVGTAGAAGVGVPERGYLYAEANCTECHAIDRGDYESPYYGAPAFSEIANVPAMSELALYSFFQTPHPTMPNLMVPPGDIRDLVAYIRSLRK